MIWIALLILIGILLYIIELILLPGITVAAVGAFVSLVSAVVLGYSWYDGVWGTVILIITVALMVAMTIISLRSNTWRRFTLHTNVDSAAGEKAEASVSVGDVGTTITRLAPMGRVSIGGESYEAKSVDSYIDPREKVEVIAFENSQIIVRKHR